jgi:hypothetical protein
MHKQRTPAGSMSDTGTAVPAHSGRQAVPPPFPFVPDIAAPGDAAISSPPALPTQDQTPQRPVSNTGSLLLTPTTTNDAGACAVPHLSHQKPTDLATSSSKGTKNANGHAGAQLPFTSSFKTKTERSMILNQAAQKRCAHKVHARLSWRWRSLYPVLSGDLVAPTLRSRHVCPPRGSS